MIGRVAVWQAVLGSRPAPLAVLPRSFELPCFACGAGRPAQAVRCSSRTWPRGREGQPRRLTNNTTRVLHSRGFVRGLVWRMPWAGGCLSSLRGAGGRRPSGLVMECSFASCVRRCLILSLPVVAAPVARALVHVFVRAGWRVVRGGCGEAPPMLP